MKFEYEKYEKDFLSYWLGTMSGDRSKKAYPSDARRIVDKTEKSLKYLLKKLKDTIPPLKYKGVDAVPLYINYTEAYALLALIVAYVGNE